MHTARHDRQTDGRTDGRTDGQQEEAAGMPACLSACLRPLPCACRCLGWGWVKAWAAMGGVALRAVRTSEGCWLMERRAGKGCFVTLGVGNKRKAVWWEIRMSERERTKPKSIA